MWWKKPYINRRDWILENMGSLSLSGEEAVIVLMVDFLNSQKTEISLEILSDRTGINIDQVDASIQSLVSKSFLNFEVKNQNLLFTIDGIFDDNLHYEHVDTNIFNTFETEFGRLLSQNELQLLNTWLQKYSQEDILSALSSAIIYKKVSMQYINAILADKSRASYT